MKNKKIENSKVRIMGTVCGELAFDHEHFGEDFYSFFVTVKRMSGMEDRVPCIVSGKLCNVQNILDGMLVEISGQFRSYNFYSGERNHLVLYVFISDIQLQKSGINLQNVEGNNEITLNGFICKPPVYRKTPGGRRITDLLLAVNRPYGKSDYIPCICWGKSAMYVSKMEVGTHVNLCGRIQSRQYAKKCGEAVKVLTAYEVSVSKVEVSDD